MKTETLCEETDVNNVIEVSSLLHIPSVAQRLLRAGYKPISQGQIRQRFAIDEMNSKLEKEKSKYTCILKSVCLDRYANDVMPDRVIESIERATALGVNHYEVCWPEIIDRKMLDPIVIGTFLMEDEKPTWDKGWFEITSWE